MSENAMDLIKLINQVQNPRKNKKRKEILVGKSKLIANGINIYPWLFQYQNYKLFTINLAKHTLK